MVTDMSKEKKIPLIIILVAAGLFLLGRFGLKLGSWEFDSYEKFRKTAYVRFSVDIPEGAADQKFFCNNSGVRRYSLYAFTLDKDGYDKLIRSMVEKYHVESNPESAYAQYYLKKAGEVYNPNSVADSFPINLRYDKVINDDISSYTIILYSPMHSGSSCSAMVANPVTGRIVVMNRGNIR